MAITKEDLEKYEILKGVTPELLTKIASFASYEDFEPGDCLTFEGTPAENFFLIEEGKVSILTERWDESLPQGEELRPIQTLNKGDVLGWSWIVSPYVWSFTANALTRTQTIQIDGLKLRDYLDLNPWYGYELLKRFVRMLKDRLIAARLHLALNNGKAFKQSEGG